MIKTQLEPQAHIYSIVPSMLQCATRRAVAVAAIAYSTPAVMSLQLPLQPPKGSAAAVP
jgi:hypothetical protein